MMRMIKGKEMYKVEICESEDPNLVYSKENLHLHAQASDCVFIPSLYFWAEFWQNEEKGGIPFSVSTFLGLQQVLNSSFN